MNYRKIEVWLGLVLLCSFSQILPAQEIVEPVAIPEETAQERLLIKKLEEEVFGYAKKSDPEVLKKLQELESQNSASFYREIFRVLENHRKLSKEESRVLMARATMLRLREVDAAQYELAVNKKRLERQSLELVEAFKRASDAHVRLALHAKLAETVSELFDLRERERQFYVAQLEERLLQLKKALVERQQNRKRIIESHVADLLEDTEKAEW